MTAREAWKILYRRLRVARREMAKATNDTLIYGTGGVMFPADVRDPYHIPLWQLVSGAEVKKTVDMETLSKDLYGINLSSLFK